MQDSTPCCRRQSRIRLSAVRKTRDSIPGCPGQSGDQLQTIVKMAALHLNQFLFSRSLFRKEDNTIRFVLKQFPLFPELGNFCVRVIPLPESFLIPVGLLEEVEQLLVLAPEGVHGLVLGQLSQHLLELLQQQRQPNPVKWVVLYHQMNHIVGIMQFVPHFTVRRIRIKKISFAVLAS